MSEYEDKRAVGLSLLALKALIELEGVGRNPLSPLLALKQLRAGQADGAADGAELAARLEEMDGAWQWAAPALVDPQRTVSLLYADSEHARLGQYLFPDTEGVGPAFNADLSGEGLRLTGPWSLGEIRMALLEYFALEGVADSPPARLDLTRAQFWGVAAYVDSYRAARLDRELARLGGFPEGVSVPAVVESWSSGMAKPDPGWAVSLLSLLEPDERIAGFEAGIPAVLAELAGAGLLEYVHLDGEGGYYAPRGDLQRLCLEVARSNAAFSLVLRHIAGPSTVEATMLFGWRTSEGVWLAEISPSGEGQVGILQLGPYLFVDIVAELLAEPSRKAAAGMTPDTATAFAMETPFSRDALISLLRTAPADEGPAPELTAPTPERAAPTPGRKFCIKCGAPLVEGNAFCTKCGQRV